MHFSLPLSPFAPENPFLRDGFNRYRYRPVPLRHMLILFQEHFSCRNRLTIWGGGESMTPSLGKSLGQPLQGTGLHDPLLGRQTCSKSTFFHKRVDQTCPRGADISRVVPFQNGGKRARILVVSTSSPPPPDSLNDSQVQVDIA